MAKLDRVPVTFMQDDMASSVYDLPYPRHDKPGKELLTDKIAWAEVWIAERKADGMVWSGTIRDGELYLDVSAKNGARNERGAAQQRPSLLTAGFYKIWIDAWLRPGEKTYGAERFTKTDHFGDDDASRWKAAPVPPRKHWQDVQVRRPKGGGPALVFAKSRRFHWIYRLSRLVFALDERLQARDAEVVLVTRVRDLAVYLLSFLAAIEDSNTLALKVPMLRALDKGEKVPADPEDWPDWRKLREMQGLIHGGFVGSENFVRWGVGGNDGAVADHQHVNNLAHALWTLINDPDFQEEVFAIEPLLANEHRALIARIPGVLNRVPLALRSVELNPRTGDHEPIGVSRRYGDEFARAFGRPFLDRLASGEPAFMQEAGGGSGPAAGNAKGAGAAAGKKFAKQVKWLDSVRKYCWAMMNGLSTTIMRKPGDVEKVVTVLEKLDRNTFQALRLEEEKFRRLGRSDEVRRIAAQRRDLKAESKLWKKFAGISEYEDFKDLEKQLTEARGNQPERIGDALKRGAPLAMYMIDSFEICVKTLVAKVAWDAFFVELRKQNNTAARVRTGAEAWIRTMDVGTTILKSTAFKNLVKWIAGSTKDNPVKGVDAWLDKWDYRAKWGSVGIDLYSAWTYGADIFNYAYGDKLLEKYVPEDAVTAYGFHLVIWGGKWMNAAGNAIATKGKAPPLGYLVQGLGYLAQFIGEFGEAAVGVGGLEHKHFVNVHTALEDAARLVHNKLVRHELNVYAWDDWRRVHQMAASFEWRGLDRDVYRGQFGLAAG